MEKFEDMFFEYIKSPAGGYNRATLNRYGISWPPKKGWKKVIMQSLMRSDSLLAVEILREKLGDKKFEESVSDGSMELIIDAMIKFKFGKELTKNGKYA